MNHSSAGSFCSLVVATATGTVDSVTSVNVAARGDGAEVYCVANQSVYRYNATSTQTTIGDTFLAPLSGGGCWFKQDAESDFASDIVGANSVFQGLVLGSPAVVGTWHALPVSANAYFVSKTSLMWSTDTTTGIITYNGPSGLKFKVDANLSFSRNTFGTPLIYEVDITTNGFLIGLTNETSTATASALTGTQDILANFPNSRIIVPNNGDTMQHCLRRLTTAIGSGSETFSHYSAIITRV